MKRRDFIKTTAVAVPAMSLFPADLASITRGFLPGMIEKRSLGRTGEMLSMIGFGGIIVKDAAHLSLVLQGLYSEFLTKGFIECNSTDTEQFSRRIQVQKLAEIINNNGK